jgi:AraC-like DNA-binding protein
VDCYLRDHLERPLQVQQLAQQVSLSVSHFCRAFKDSFGTTPHIHIIRLRLDRAKQLMLATQDPLSEIALRCGFADQAHLSKLFRRWMGETPNAWRRRNITDPQSDLRNRRSVEGQTGRPRLAA